MELWLREQTSEGTSAERTSRRWDIGLREQGAKRTYNYIHLKQNEAQSARAQSTNRGVNHRSKYVTQVQQQRPESPTVTLTSHSCKYKVHTLNQRYIPCVLIEEIWAVSQ